MNKLAYKCLALCGCFALLAAYHRAEAQAPASPPVDSSRIIHLLNADELMGIQPGPKDSSQFQKLTGNVRLMQGQTIFSCDSALQNLTLNTMDAYGHIHINQGDTIHTYSDFLHYEGNTKIATLTRNVRMTDGQMVLTTNLLNYDMNTHIGNYVDGGKLVTGSTVLTSRRGYYFADTKDAYFKERVELTDPEYTLATDTLLYNSDTRIATFVAPTTINTGGTLIHTACGYYNTLENYAHLCDRSDVVDSSQRLTADSLNFNRNTGIGIALGNVIWTDTARQMSVLANYAISDQQKSTILATQKPLLILERKTDTLFVAEDTLFSGPLLPPGDTTGMHAAAGPSASPQDSALLTPLIPSRDSLGAGKNDAHASGDSVLRARDSVALRRSDSLRIPADTAARPDTVPRRYAPVPSVREDSLAHRPPPPDSLFPGSLPLPGARPATPDTTAPADTLGTPHSRTPASDSLPPKLPPPAVSRQPASGQGTGAAKSDTSSAPHDTTSPRYVIAFHHVRMFSDSLQGVADSLYYSDVDSAFHFYGNPVLWTGNSQLTGDTIVLTTRNQEADRILLINHALIINQSGPGLFNQIKGTRITGYFKEGNQLDWMEADGNAESMYYAQDDNGAYVGANRSTSAMIRMYFLDGKLNKVVLIKDVDGNFLPPTKIPEEDQKLRGFKWMEDQRPKSRAELMH